MGIAPDDFDALLDRAKSGDSSALGSLIDPYRPWLLGKAGPLVGDRVARRFDPGDVVQLTYLNACREFGSFQGGSPGELAAWLERILENSLSRLIRDHTRLQKRAVGREQAGDAAGDGFPGHLTSPSEKAIRREDAEKLVLALARLPRDQREAVRLRHLEGWPLTRIAAELGKSIPATAGLIKRGLKALREDYPVG